jgi:hypothetical protein
MNALRFSICLALLVSCAKKDSPPRTREEFCRDWADAACTDEVVSRCQAKSEEDCHQSQQEFCSDLVPEDFSDAEGDACIEAVHKAYSDGDLKGNELVTVLSLGGACAQLIVGPQGDGDSCSSNQDCDQSDGLSCVKKSTAAKGTCAVAEEVEPGRSCSAAREMCSEDFYCDGKHCVEAKTDGDDCKIDEECGLAGFCNDDGACEERHDVDESCTADKQCKSGVCYAFEGDKVCTDRIVLARSETLCSSLR